MQIKFTIIFLLIAILQVSAKGYSQQKISLSEKDAPIEKLFKEIRSQTGYQFLYSDQLIEKTNRVTINVINASLEEVLDICFKDQPLTYAIVEKTIVVKEKEVKKNEDPNTLIDISTKLIGKVVDKATTHPLEGATVQVKGEKINAITDQNGVFVFNNIDDSAILIISFTGYANREINVKGKTSLVVELEQTVSELQEVVVRKGYYDEKRSVATGNVSTVSAKEIERQPVENPLLALEGRVPGTFIQQYSGLPGSAVKVQIRGQNSIFNGNDPLYIVDGVPYTGTNYLTSINYVLGNSSTSSTVGQMMFGSPLSYINPADIESIDILKDADATAIYGSRGANGVVLITTKKGKIGQTKVDINVQTGFGKVADKVRLLNTRQYLDMRYEAFKNDGASPNPNADFDLTLWDTTRQTDWQKTLLGGTARYTDIQATVSGGNANTQFLIGTGYNKQTTVFPGDFSDQKGSVHFNINNVSPNARFRIQLSGLYVFDDNLLSAYDLTQQAMELAPDAPPMYNPDGTINWALTPSGISTWPVYNPATMLLAEYENQTHNLISNAMISYHLLPGLDIKSSFGYTATQTNETQGIPLTFFPPAQRPYKERTADFTDNSTYSWIIEPQISYTRKITADGILTALLGITIQQSRSNGQVLEGTGFNSDLVMKDIKSATSITALSTTDNIYKYNAGFGRLNYDWKDKYLINLTARRDGSSRFGPANQFHNFGAIGLGWIFSKEKFVQKILPFMNYGKLRGSFGTTGSDQVGDYTFMDLYAPIGVGVPYQGAIGFSPARIFTPDLAWEETKKLEAALEISFFQDRIIFTASFYRNRSTNQIVGYTLPIVTGFTFVEKNLDALVQNKGWEFDLKTVNIKYKSFEWSSSLNLTINRNKLVSGAEGLSDYYQAKVGHSLSSSFVYHSLGVDPATGFYQMADSAGKPTSTPNPVTDATVLEDISPSFYGGFENSLTYKGFQLDIMLQFKEQPEAFYFPYADIPGNFNQSFGGNQPVTVLDRWQKPGDVKPVQRFSQDLSTYQSGRNARSSDQFFANASYIRLTNVSLSWELPNTWKKSVHLQNANLYIHAQNLLTITNYPGLNPETIGSTGLPPLRVFTGGIHLTF